MLKRQLLLLCVFDCPFALEWHAHQGVDGDGYNEHGEEIHNLAQKVTWK